MMKNLHERNHGGPAVDRHLIPTQTPVRVLQVQNQGRALLQIQTLPQVDHPLGQDLATDEGAFRNRGAEATIVISTFNLNLVDTITTATVYQGIMYTRDPLIRFAEVYIRATSEGM